MYMTLVRKLVELSVEKYAEQNDLTKGQVLEKIREQIDATSAQHFQPKPNINYKSTLCRVGYLYRHGPAQATLFERTLRGSSLLQAKVRKAYGDNLNVVAVGGGPGTELLGLGKYLLDHEPKHPRRINFAVLDIIPHWAETWKMMAREVEATLERRLRNTGNRVPAIAPMFHPLDVVDPDSYDDYDFLFDDADIVVFNYIFSENKTQLDSARRAVRHIWRKVPKGCVFVVIDRLEQNTTFQSDVENLIKAATGGVVPTIKTIGDTIDEAADMGSLTRTLLNPRMKFFTPTYRNPTVFWCAFEKP
ncbi:MAG TPA: hypothetical protein VEA77_06660 [Hyphomicrobium sp.]|nr:hypothetical protein [Hyphomicrobium sp.]